MQKLKFNTDMADERVDEDKEINNMSDIDGIEIDVIWLHPKNEIVSKL